MPRVTLILILSTLSACASSTSIHPHPAARIQPADLVALTGPPWTGTLTYLDYQSNKPVTIESSLIVTRLPGEPPSWEFGVGYSNEPHADAKETIALSRGGEMLGNESVISRERNATGLTIITECDGQDDNRDARFRFETLITADHYTRRKLVRFEGKTEFFERHVYQLAR